MSRSNVYDMTKGRELPLLLKFSIPMLFGNIFQQLYNLVDSIIVGQFVGANALGAVGATGSSTFLLFSLCNGLSIGIGILIAQYFGANNTENVKKSIANAIYVVVVSGVIMSLLGVIVTRPVLELLKTPAAIIEDSVTYMRIACAGTIAVIGYNAMASILRALGDSKTPLIFLVIASVINVILDLTFIICFQMGVAGAAIATIISQAISTIGCIIFAVARNPYFKLEKEHLKVDSKIISKSIKIGIPVAFQNSLIAFSCIVLQGVVNTFGETIVTVYTTSNRIEQLVQQPYNSLGAAVSTFTGQNMGADKIDRVKRGYRISVVIVVIISAIMFVFMQLFGGNVISLFTGEQEIVRLGSKALKITSCFYFGLGMIYVSRALLNGAGDAIASMINGFVEVIGRVFFPVILIHVFSVGYLGVWYTTGLTWTITGLTVFIRYLQGKWKQKSLVHRG